MNLLTTEHEARAYVASLTNTAGMDRLERFIHLLGDENEVQNLVSRPSLGTVWTRHIADSAQLVRIVPRETILSSATPWVDIGSGAGFPGLTVSCIRPDWHVILIEPRKRRADFLQQCVTELKLENCTVLATRVENVTNVRASVISARAVAPLSRLLRISAGLAVQNTVFLFPKGRSAKSDLELISDDRAHMFHVEPSLTDPNAGIIVGGVETLSGKISC